MKDFALHSEFPGTRDQKRTFPNGDHVPAHLSRMALWRLIFSKNWPEQFQGGKTPQKRAKLAMARIDHFIATKGRF